MKTYVKLCKKLKKNYVNKYLITFNDYSNAFIDKIIYNILPKVTMLNKSNEQKLKFLSKTIMAKNIGNNSDDDKKLKIRKKIFNNIKMMAYERKDINFDLNN